MSQELPSETQKLLGTDVTVNGLRPDVDLNGYLWTFNRSNVRIRWMYNLYLHVATGIAYGFGARAYFMGYESKKLRDDPELARNIWLLIAYPTAGHFLNLFTSLRFESMNLTIGTLSVKQRLFGFSKRLDDGPMPPDERTYYTGGRPYLIHYYKADDGEVLRRYQEKLTALASSRNASVFFMGVRVATLRLGSSSLDSPSDGAMIFEGSDAATLEKLIDEPGYQEFLDQTTGNYIALYERRI